LVVALGREDDERVGDVVGDDAHLLLEDRWRALGLPRYAGRSGRPAGERDTARAARRSGHRSHTPRAHAASGAADAAPAEPPARAAGASPLKPSPRHSGHARLLRRDPACAAAAPGAPAGAR